MLSMSHTFHTQSISLYECQYCSISADGISSSNVTLQREQCHVTGATMTFPPHMLIEVRRHHVLGGAKHLLKLPLHSVPVSFHVIRANTSLRILEIHTVVNSAVLIPKAAYLSIRSPFIRPDDGSYNKCSNVMSDK